MLRKVPFAAIFFVKVVQAAAPSLPPHQTFECLKALRNKGFLQAGIYRQDEAFIFANTAVPPPALWVATPDAFRRAPLPSTATKTDNLPRETLRTYEFKVDGPKIKNITQSYPIEAQLSTPTPAQSTTQATPIFGLSFNPAATPAFEILTLKEISATEKSKIETLKSLGFEEVTPGAAEIFGTFFDGVMDSMKEKYVQDARKLEPRHFAKQNEELTKKDYLPALKICAEVPEFAPYTEKLKLFMSEATEKSIKEH